MLEISFGFCYNQNMDKAFIISKDIYDIYPDELHGLLYCYNGHKDKVFVVDTNSGEIVGNFKVGINTVHLYFNETKEFIFVQGCDRKISVWQVNKYDEPYWNFNLKGIDNSDEEFVCKDNVLYGFSSTLYKRASATRYFVIDLISREIKTEVCPFDSLHRENSVGGEVHDAVERIYDEGLKLQDSRWRRLFSPIPEEYSELLKSARYSNYYYKDYYYKTDKFGFLLANLSESKLIAIPHGAQLPESLLLAQKQEKQEKKTSDFTEEYIKTHGLTKEFLEESDDGEIMYFGYFWALHQIENKSKAAGIPFNEFLGSGEVTDVESVLYSIDWFQTEIDEGGATQYFDNGTAAEFNSLIKALTLVNASETLKAVKKCVAIWERYNNLQNPSEDDFEAFSEKIEDVLGDVTEDYIEKAVEYVKRTIIAQ